MNPIDILLLLWMLVFPILGIVTPIFGVILYFFLIPKIARKLTWDRFRKVSYHFVGDSSGYAYLLSTEEEIPEGIERTKHGWHFLPRPKFKSNNPGFSEDQLEAEKLALKKYTWKDMGKPIWLDYAGKVASTNPATLAVLQQNEESKINLTPYFEKIYAELKDMPTRFEKPLNKLLTELRKAIDAVPLTVMDPSVMKEVLPQMYTPSQLKALATNREQYGAEKRGHEYGRLILGGAIIIGLVILGVVAMAMLLK